MLQHVPCLSSVFSAGAYIACPPLLFPPSLHLAATTLDCLRTIRSRTFGSLRPRAFRFSCARCSPQLYRHWWIQCLPASGRTNQMPLWMPLAACCLRRLKVWLRATIVTYGWLYALFF